MEISDWPRVTEILRVVGLGPDLSRVPADLLEIARDRGSRLHELLEADHYGFADEIPPDLAGHFSAYQKFLVETSHVPIVSEAVVYHEAWRYRGRLDRIGWLTLKDFTGHRTVLDFKSGGSEGVEYQLAAYVAAWNAQHPKAPIDRAVAVALRKNGTYRLLPDRNGKIGVDLRAATTVWQAAVVVFHARGGK